MKAALLELDENNGDSSPIFDIASLFHLFRLLRGQVFSTSSYPRRKNILKTLTDGKSR